MTPILQLVMEYIFNHRLPRYLDRAAWDKAKALEAKNLAALRDGLPENRLSSLERLLDAREEVRDLELQALFLAALAAAWELYVE